MKIRYLYGLPSLSRLWPHFLFYSVCGGPHFQWMNATYRPQIARISRSQDMYSARGKEPKIKTSQLVVGQLKWLHLPSCGCIVIYPSCGQIGDAAQFTMENPPKHACAMVHCEDFAKSIKSSMIYGLNRRLQNDLSYIKYTSYGTLFNGFRLVDFICFISFKRRRAIWLRARGLHKLTDSKIGLLTARAHIRSSNSASKDVKCNKWMPQCCMHAFDGDIFKIREGKEPTTANHIFFFFLNTHYACILNTHIPAVYASPDHSLSWLLLLLRYGAVG